MNNRVIDGNRIAEVDDSIVIINRSEKRILYLSKGQDGENTISFQLLANHRFGSRFASCDFPVEAVNVLMEARESDDKEWVKDVDGSRISKNETGVSIHRNDKPYLAMFKFDSEIILRIIQNPAKFRDTEKFPFEVLKTAFKMFRMMSTKRVVDGMIISRDDEGTVRIKYDEDESELILMRKAGKIEIIVPGKCPVRYSYFGPISPEVLKAALEMFEEFEGESKIKESKSFQKIPCNEELNI